MTDHLDVTLDGTSYCCHRVREPKTAADTYFVAGLGALTIARDTGEIVSTAGLSVERTSILEKLAPLIFRTSKSI